LTQVCGKPGVAGYCCGRVFVRISVVDCCCESCSEMLSSLWHVVAAGYSHKLLRPLLRITCSELVVIVAEAWGALRRVLLPFIVAGWSIDIRILSGVKLIIFTMTNLQGQKKNQTALPQCHGLKFYQGHTPEGIYRSLIRDPRYEQATSLRTESRSRRARKSSWLFELIYRSKQL